MNNEQQELRVICEHEMVTDTLNSFPHLDPTTVRQAISGLFDDVDLHCFNVEFDQMLGDYGE